MRFKNLTATLLATATLLLSFGIALPAAADVLAPVSPTVAIPTFKIPGLNGTSLSDTDLRNKVTIIRFWASW